MVRPLTASCNVRNIKRWCVTRQNSAHRENLGFSGHGATCLGDSCRIANDDDTKYRRAGQVNPAISCLKSPLSRLRMGAMPPIRFTECLPPRPIATRFVRGSADTGHCRPSIVRVSERLRDRQHPSVRFQDIAMLMLSSTVVGTTMTMVTDVCELKATRGESEVPPAPHGCTRPQLSCTCAGFV